MFELMYVCTQNIKSTTVRFEKTKEKLRKNWGRAKLQGKQNPAKEKIVQFNKKKRKGRRHVCFIKHTQVRASAQIQIHVRTHSSNSSSHEPGNMS